MLRALFAFLFLFSAQVTLADAIQDTQKDIDSIKKMAGCYAVRFNMLETVKIDPNHPIKSEPYQEYGTEWVTVDKETTNEVHLQHILLTPDGVQKHWRQEWELNPSTVMTYQGDNSWATNHYKGNIGAWNQRVYQVDDSPRYACVARWNHNDEGSSWTCKTPSPLPRREFSKRSDYNLMVRENRHILTNWGWRQDENNEKVLRVDGKDTLIAEEAGSNTYRKISDEKCAAAQTWWNGNKKIWNDIQDMWRHVLTKHPYIKLKGKVEDQTLWMRLFDLADRYAAKQSYSTKELQKEAHDIIHLYMENHE